MSVISLGQRSGQRSGQRDFLLPTPNHSRSNRTKANRRPTLIPQKEMLEEPKEMLEEPKENRRPITNHPLSMREPPPELLVRLRPYIKELLY